MAKMQTLCEFLANSGGVRSFKHQRSTVGACDLKAIGADTWHKAAPFRKKLMRVDSGFSPDDAALAAYEAGYFPEWSERPDIQDLIDAIDRELSGKPVYTAQDEQEIFNAAMQAYEREETMEGFRAMAEVDGRIIPPNSEAVSGLNGEIVYLYETLYVTKKGREGKSFYAKAFQAGEKKHAWHHVFDSHEARMDKVNEFFAEAGELV